MVGDPGAPDKAILAWAYRYGHVVFTHDLDFGAILAAAGHTQPSVIQVRTQNVAPAHLGKIVLTALKQFENLLRQGALITIHEDKMRARTLPLEGHFGI
jgi:predicted nuclease of predicted toxin-antitoxin system